MSDLYRTLGLTSGATDADIKRAYRGLAKKLHPDVNKDDNDIADRFKRVSAAYAILGDSDKRARYDRGEIDDMGNERAAAFGAGARAGGRNGYSNGGSAFHEFDMDDAQDIFSEFFRASGGAGGRSGFRSGASTRNRSEESWSGRGGRKHRGLDITYNITIAFDESVRGCKRRLVLNDGREIDINIPAGIRDGQVIRLAGQGGDGFGGGHKGDALVEIEVAPHPHYARKGLDLHLDLPISLDEAILGGEVEVPTPYGKITVRVPKGASSGQRLRLKGKGIKKGDDQGHIYASLKVVLPDSLDDEMEQAVRDWIARSQNGASQGPSIRRKAGLR